MKLFIGKVYIYDSDIIYIKGKRKFKKRIIYTIQKVFKNGSLGQEFERMFKRGECKIAKKYKAITYIKIPEEVKDVGRFKNLVSRSRKLIKSKDEDYKLRVAELAICCSGFQHLTEGRAYNLRDFARAVKFKSFNTLYRWVLAYYTIHYTEKKFKYAIPEAADTTIVNMIINHQETYKSYYGFNKKLDKLLTKNAKAYLLEFNTRGLSL